MLFLFFALESILGNKAEGLKAHSLALNRAMLGLIVDGGFAHPARTYLLYDEVRSAAVHGEEAPEVDEKVVRQFADDVRVAINQYLWFAVDRGFTKRKQLRCALQADERRANLIKSLLNDDPKLWADLRTI